MRATLRALVAQTEHYLEGERRIYNLGILRSAPKKVFTKSMICPLLNSILIDPVVATDGFSYERCAIERWLRKRRTSPVTGKRLGMRLLANHALRAAIDEIDERHQSR